MLRLPVKELSRTHGFHVFFCICQNALCCILWDMNKCRNPLNSVFLNTSIEFNETTMVPQNTALWESRSHPHNSTFYKSTTFFSYDITSTHQHGQLRCLMEFTPTIILKLFCVFFSILFTLHPSIYSIKALPSDFIYESNTVLRISEYTLSTQELSQSLKNTYFLFPFSPLFIGPTSEKEYHFP